MHSISVLLDHRLLVALGLLDRLIKFFGSSDGEVRALAGVGLAHTRSAMNESRRTTHEYDLDLKGVLPMLKWWNARGPPNA